MQTIAIEECPIKGYAWAGQPPRSTRVLAMIAAHLRGSPITETSVSAVVAERCQNGRFSIQHELATLHKLGALRPGEMHQGEMGYQLAADKHLQVLFEPYTTPH